MEVLTSILTLIIILLIMIIIYLIRQRPKPCCSSPEQHHLCYQKELVPPLNYDHYLEDITTYKNKVAHHLEKTYMPEVRNIAARGSGTSGTMSEKASRHITFTLNYLKSFIGEMETVAGQLGYDREKLALSFSYGIYSRSTPHGSNDYWTLQTLFGIPALIGDDGIAVRRFIERKEIITKDKNGKDSVSYQYIDQTDCLDEENIPPIHFILMSTSAAPKPSPALHGFNQGQLCPANCPL